MVSDATQADLVSTSGPIKLISDTGSITVQDGDTNGSGVSSASDVLLRARQDLILNSDVRSVRGHITLRSGDDIDLNANVTTLGGSVFLTATNDTNDAIRGVDMAAGTTVSSGGGNVRVLADNEGDILLSLIDAGAGDVSLLAEGSILDNNFATNIRADALRMVADAAISNASNQVGSIGLADFANGSPDTNRHAIDTVVSVLSARSADGIYVQELDSVVVDATGDITIQEVRFNSTVTARTDATQSDLVTTDSGPIKVLSTTGSITVNDGNNNGFGISAATTGDVLLRARQDITLNSDILSGTGHVTLSSGDDIDQNADIETSGGTVFLVATNDTADAIRGVDMAAGTFVRTNGGNVRVVSDNEGDILLSLIDAGSGDVSLLAEGSILDNNFSTNVRADALRMVADASLSNASNQVGSIGLADTTNGTPNVNRHAIDTVVNILAARSADGIYVQELDSVRIDSTSDITIQEVRFNSTLTARTDASQSDLVTTDAGSIKLVSTTGSVTVNDGNNNGFGISAATTGDVLLSSRQDNAFNADILSGSGNITLIGGDDIDQNADIATTGGTVYLVATNDTVDAIRGVDMAAGTFISTSGGNVRVLSDNEGDILLSLIDAGSGDVSLLAEGSILDNNFATNVRADALRMVADAALSNASNQVGSIGSSDTLNGLPDVNQNAIDTAVKTLAARSADGIYVLEFDTVTIDATSAIAVEEVRFNSTRTVRSDVSQSDLVTTDAGAIKLVSATGTIVINDGDNNGFGVSAATTGDVLLRARQDVVVNSDVLSGRGHVTLSSGDDIDLNADVTTVGGSVYLAATNDSFDAIRGVDMAQGTFISTSGGNVRILADNEGDVLLSLIDAGSGEVSLLAEGSILDNNFATNIRADALRMVADAAISNASNQAGSIGLADGLNGTPDLNANAIDTVVNILAAQSADGIYVQELDSVTIAATGDIAVEEVRFNSTRTNRTDFSLSDLVTTDAGSIKLVSTTGNITLNDGDNDGFAVNAGTSGDVLMRARQDVLVNSDVISGRGHVTLSSGDDIILNADITTNGGTVFLTATNDTIDAIRGIEMAAGTFISTNGGNVRMLADNEGSILLSLVDAGTGDVSLLAEGSILDNNLALNVRADGLRMVADAALSNASNQVGSIGLADTSNGLPDTDRNAIDTEVNTITGRSADGIYVSELNTVLVDASGDITVQEVRFNSTLTERTDVTQSDLVTTDAGSIKLVSLNGSILINDGNGNGFGIAAASSGDVLLRARQDVVINEDIRSGTGHISLLSGDDIDLNADVNTAGGTVFLAATNDTVDAIRGVDMAAGTSIRSSGGNVRVLADHEGDILLSLIDAGSGKVSLLGEGSILDNNFTVNVRAEGLRMVADAAISNASNQVGSIGRADTANGLPNSNRHAIDLAVNVIAARSADGIYVEEFDSVRVDATGDINIEEVRFNSTRTFRTDLTLSDLVTTDAGAIKLVSTSGNITVNDGDSDGHGISAATSGEVLLRARQDVVINSDLLSGSGHISLLSGDDIDLNADVVTTGGTVYLSATNDTTDGIRGIDMAAGTFISTSGGNVRAVADNEGDILLALVDAGTGDVSLIAEGSILNNNFSTNVRADALRIVADAAVSNASNQVGSIGLADTANGSPDTNRHAIDTAVNTLSARSADGIYVQEFDSVVVDATGDIAIQEVRFNSTLTVRTDISQSDLVTTDAGAIKLVSTTGNVTVNDGNNSGFGISAAATGDILVKALQDVAVNSDILSGSGHVTVSSGDDIDQNADIVTGGGTVYLVATNATADAIRGVDMAAGTFVRTSGGNVRVVSDNEGDILLSLIDAGAGDVSLLAERSILDNNFATNIRANALRMVADAAISNASNQVGSIGLADIANGSPDTNRHAIDTVVSVLSARSADGIYVQELDSVVVDATGDITVQEVRFNSTVTARTDATQSDLVTTDSGAIKVLSTTGSITVNDGNNNGFGISAAKTGDVLLRARQDITLNSDILSGTGHVTLSSGDDIDQNADIETSSGTVYLVATNDTADAIRGVDMAAGTFVRTNGGNVRMVSDNEGDILLSLIDAGSGNVSLLAEGSILDNNFSTNVRADALRMVADASISNVSNQVGSIGLADTANGTPNVNRHAIDTAVNILAARSADGIYVQELDSVRIDSTSDITIQEVRFNSTLTARTDASQSDLVTTDAGPIKLVSTTGSVTVNDGNNNGFGISAATTGDVLLSSRQDIAFNADILSGSGNITLISGDDIDQNADIATTGGTVYLVATNDTVDAIRGVDMAAGTFISTSGGNVRVLSDNEGDILLSLIDAGTGDVSLLAEGSILDNNFATNVRADALRMVADAALSNASNQVGSIGLADQNNGTPDTNRHAIDTVVSILAARSADGIYVQEFDSITVDATGDISVQEVRFNSTVTTRTDASQSDLVTTDSGAIKLLSSTGNITINDGNNNGSGISAATTGDVLLKASRDITINSDILSGSGHITLSAGDDIDQNADIVTVGGTIYLAAKNDTSDAIRGVDMAAGTFIRTSGGNVRIISDNEGDILLSLIDAGSGDVSLLAEGSILDNNFATNVRADALRMVADASLSNASNQVGSIGLADLSNTSPGTNRNAIDTAVTTLAARSADGIYVQELDSVAIDATGAITIQEVRFNSSLTARTDVTQSDLVTTDAGSIKLVSTTGSISINDGNSNGFGVSAATTGDVLLSALNDVVINSDVGSLTGRIHFNADDDIDVNADVQTAGTGTVLLNANNRNSDAVGPEVNGINIDGTIRTASGDILMISSLDIAIRSDVSSVTGDIGLNASRDILQSANLVTGGNVLFDAGRDVSIASGNSVTGGNSILLRSVGTQSIGLLAAVNVSLDAGGNISDSNGEGVTNVRSTNLRMKATGLIGDSDLLNQNVDRNRNAIDLEVTTVAAQSGRAIYLQEVTAGLDLTIGHVDAVNVRVDSNQVNFNSTTTAVSREVTLAALDDLTAPGAIKVVVEAGSLFVNAGTDNDGLAINATNDGDILLEARGRASDVVIGIAADIVSGSGHISLLAGDDVRLVGDVTTLGSTIYMRADNGTSDANSGVIFSDNAFASTFGGKILIEANNESDIVLGFLDTVDTDFGAGSVSLKATRSILDGADDLADLNVQTGILRMEADSNGDGSGAIGLASPVNSAFINAIDTQARTLAAKSAEGIYVREVDGVTVRSTGDISVEQVRFNSSRTPVTHAALSDLETTNNGNITLVSDFGNITIEDGDADTNGIVAHGSGNILLITGAANGDIVVDANVQSSTGQITFSAGSDIVLSATIRTDRGGVSPDILLQAVTGSIDEGRINGDQAKVIASSLKLQAALHAHLHDTTVDTLQASVGSNGALQAWQLVNERASQRGDDFLLEALGLSRTDFARRNGVLLEVDPSQADNPAQAADPDANLNILAPNNNPLRQTYEAIEKLHRFADTYAGQYALFIKNSQSIDVELVTAGISASPNIYIETDGQQSDLTVSGRIMTASNTDREGGIVLVAGRELNLIGELATTNTLRNQLVDRIGNSLVDNQDQFGPRRSVLNATIYNGGEGIQPQDDFTSTQFVIRLNNQSSFYEDYRTHIYQRVVTNIGFENESGFMAYIGYADGNVQQFDVAGETGIRDGSRSQLDMGDQTSIQAALGNSDAVVFSRSIAFQNSFLDSNQTLPTVAIVRRADDFFLFENAAATNAADIVDLTVEYQDVQEVRTLGAQGATELPVDPLPPAMPEPVTVIFTALTQRPTELQTKEIEFAAPPSGEVELAIYRVYYEDENSNGQPEQSELPSPDEVKSSAIADEKAAEQIDDNPEELKNKRIKLEKFKATTDGSPTAEEIDNLKQELLDDPEQQTGAYAIIQKEVDGKEVVLDVFSVRDWEETPPKDQPLIQAAPEGAKTEEGESEAGSATETGTLPKPTDSSLNDMRLNGGGQFSSESRFASAGLIVGSLWMIRQSSRSGQQGVSEATDAASDANTPIDFSRQARRARKLRGR